MEEAAAPGFRCTRLRSIAGLGSEFPSTSMHPRFLIFISFQRPFFAPPSLSKFPLFTGRAHRRCSINVCWIQAERWCGVRTLNHVVGSGENWRLSPGHCFSSTLFLQTWLLIKRHRSAQGVPRPGPLQINFPLWQETLDQSRGVCTYRVHRSSSASRLLHASQQPEIYFLLRR